MVEVFRSRAAGRAAPVSRAIELRGGLLGSLWRSDSWPDWWEEKEEMEERGYKNAWGGRVDVREAEASYLCESGPQPWR